MNDDLNVILKAQLDVNQTTKEINVQLGQLEEKIQSLGIDIDLDGLFKSFNTSFNKVKESVDAIQRSYGKIGSDNKFTESFNKLNTRVKDIRENVDALAKVKIGLDSSGDIQNALITYKNELGQVVNSTMAWKDELDELGQPTGIKTFEKVWENITDDIGVANKQLDKQKNLYKEIKTILDKLPSSAVGTANTQELYSLLDSTTEIKDLQALKDLSKQYYDESIASEKDLTNAQKLKQQSIKETFNDYKKIQDISTKVDKGLADLNSIKTSYSGSNVQDFERLENAWKNINAQVQNGTMDFQEANNEIKKLTNSTKDFETSAKKASIATNSLGDRLKKAFQYFTFYDALQMGKRALEGMVDVIFDLDNALVDLRKVSDLSGSSLEDFTRQAYSLGLEISKSGSEVIRASTAFSKAGFSDNQLLGLAESALKLTSIGDGLTDASESAETLISVMKGFGKETSEIPKIMDAINNVSNNASVNFSDVTMALQRMSGVMNASNITMEESIGMFTAINEVLRNTEMTSTSLNSISMRLRGLSEDGEAIDGLVPKLQKMYKTITDIDMTDSTGQLKNLYEIAGELAPKWATLTANQKQYIAQESAGLRQSKSFLIMMDNYNRVLEATALAYNSAGSAEQEFIKWQDSLEGRVNNLKSAIEQFASETINSSFVKSIITATTEVVKFGTAVGGAVPIILSLGTAFLAFQKGSLVSTLFTSLITQIKILTTTTIGAVGAVTALQMALGVGFVVAGVLSVSYAINSISEKANKAKEAINILSTELKDLQSQKTNVTDLSNQFVQLRQLSRSQELNNEEQKRFIDLQNQLKDLMPEVNGHYDKQGNFIISEKENIQSLTEVYEKYIDEKRKALAEASEESYGYNIDTYKDEKKKIDDLIRLQELYKTAKERSLTNDERFELNSIRDRIQVPFDELDKTIKESRSSISQSLTDVQNDIRNKLFSSDEWKKLSAGVQDSLVEELSKVSENTLPLLSEGLFNGTISLQTFIDTLKRFNEESKKTTPTVITQKTEFVKLQEAYLSGSITISEYIKQLQELNKTSQAYKREINDLAIVQEYLDGVLEKVTSNQSLSKDEVEQLVELYPELESAIYKTADGWSLESDVLSLVSTSVKNLQTAYINAQNAMSIATSSQALKRLNVTLMELESIQSIADAYRLISQKSGLNVDNIADESLLLKNANKGGVYSPILDIGKFKSQIKEYQNLILNDMNPSALQPKSTDKKDKHVEAFQKQYDELRYLRDKDLISAQQYYNGLKSLNDKYFAGNSKYIEQFRQYDTELYNLQKQLAEQHIENVINSYEKANKEIERSLTQLDLQQQLVGDNSQEYIDIENKKYNEIVKLETELQKTISELQAIGTEEAKQQAESLIDTYYDTVSERYSIIKNLQSAQISIYNDQIEELEKQKSALEDLHDFTMKMIKDELNAKKKSVQEEIKGIEEVFNRRKQALRNEQDSRNYEKGLTEKSSVVADLENQLALIKNDETAIAKRKQLEQELAKAKEDLADYQYNHSIDLAEKALDEQLEIQKSKLEEEIEELDDTLSNEVTMRELANKRIEKSGQKLKDQLIKHAKEYGTFTIEEVTNAWDVAGEAVENFDSKQQGLLATLKEISKELINTQNNLKEIEKLSTGEYANKIGAGTGTVNREQSIAKMQANSEQWTKADSQGKQQIAEENQKLGKALGLTYDSALGAWFYDKQKKLRVYHEGGVVGGTSYATKSTEELAKLLKGELVITPPQADKVMDMITNNSNSNVTISMPIVIEGNADSDTVKSLEKQVGKIADTVIEKLTTARNNTGFKKKPKFV